MSVVVIIVEVVVVLCSCSSIDIVDQSIVTHRLYMYISLFSHCYLHKQYMHEIYESTDITEVNNVRVNTCCLLYEGKNIFSLMVGIIGGWYKEK